MLPRALLLLVTITPLLGACAGSATSGLTTEGAFARLPEEIGGFHKSRPDDSNGPGLIARFAHPNRASASVHALPPTRRSGARDGEDGPEVSAAVEVFARATAVDAASRREDATFRHFGARVAESGPSARCLDVHLRGETPRRQLGCAAMLDRRVFVVTLVAPETVEPRQGARDPLLAITMRLLVALSGRAPEPERAEAAPAIELPLPLPGARPPGPPRQATPRAPAPAPPLGPAFRT
ncbi:hypothetical protein D9599_14525 [Roseomonas sp. KE2513]|uniref:hypothetical protein n=1 Tax=Roseomonas sp. KE2513 TaxID=2479202 RepID=UPI0018DF6D4B|nr:hypothetical protein [Roseomonas sp. KE2513]MBI0536789.1 hypothetical protein [Roseomonas sp. KE2513]